MTDRMSTITIDGADGSFAGHLALPASGRGPGMVVIQEIFGVNTYIKSVCDRLANMGYVALAPDMFHRSEPGFAVEPDPDGASMAAGFAKMTEYDMGNAAGDLAATLATLRGLDACTGEAGVIGFCFGGTCSFLAASDLDPTCAVSYYGSGVAGALGDKADGVECPILFHFGGQDPFLPIEQVHEVEARFADVDTAEVMVAADAGHAFDNSFDAGFSNPAAAAAAWGRTSEFLAEHLPVG